MKKHVLFLLLAMSLPLFAQTTNQWTIPTGTVCTADPEHCTYYPTPDGSAPASQRFQTGDPFTQLVFAAPSTNADYCTNFSNNTTTAVWQPVADTDLHPGPTPTVVPPTISYTNVSTVKLFTLDCVTSETYTNPILYGNLHSEILAYSYVRNYRCGSRVPTTCHRTQWSTSDGSFADETK